MITEGNKEEEEDKASKARPSMLPASGESNFSAPQMCKCGKAARSAH